EARGGGVPGGARGPAHGAGLLAGALRHRACRAAGAGRPGRGGASVRTRAARGASATSRSAGVRGAQAVGGVPLRPRRSRRRVLSRRTRRPAGSGGGPREGAGPVVVPAPRSPLGGLSDGRAPTTSRVRSLRRPRDVAGDPRVSRRGAAADPLA